MSIDTGGTAGTGSDPGLAALDTSRLLRPSDADLVPLALDASRLRGSFQVHRTIARPDGILYGGSGAAVAVMAMEAATARPARWVTVQFVASPQVGELVETEVDVVAAGHRISQVQVRATVEGRLVFSAVGATATGRPAGLHGQFDAVPRVGPPAEGRDIFEGLDIGDNLGHHERYDLVPPTASVTTEAADLPLWTRFCGPQPFTPATIAFVADMVPMAISKAAGVLGAGSSLDNTLRFGATPAPGLEWLLLDLHGQLADEGYGHGSLEVWTPDGELVALGSQTATMNKTFRPTG